MFETFQHAMKQRYPVSIKKWRRREQIKQFSV